MTHTNLDTRLEGVEYSRQLLLVELGQSKPGVVQEVGQIRVRDLLRRSLRPRKRSRRSVSSNLAEYLHQTGLQQKRLKLTIPSRRFNILPRHDAAFLATAFTSNGSNRAASNSFTTMRATFTPSLAPGGTLAPPANACPTASLILFVDLER